MHDTSGGPRLPDFILAGAPRCGTTSVYHMLKAHPDVFLPEKKELWFFYTDSQWERGADWYARCFAGHGGAAVAGEATPLYFCDPRAVERMREIVPGVKLLLVLRDPVQRLFSHYWFNIRKSKEDLSMEAAVRDELSAGPRPWKLDKGALNYVGIGRYDEHLARLREVFSPEQVHVMVIEEVAADPVRAFGALWAFLGVPAMALPPVPERNKDRWLRSHAGAGLYRHHGAKRLLSSLLPEPAKAMLRRLRDRVAFVDEPPAMPEALRRELEEHYAHHVAALEGMIGRKLPAWLPGRPR